MRCIRPHNVRSQGGGVVVRWSVRGIYRTISLVGNGQRRYGYRKRPRNASRGIGSFVSIHNVSRILTQNWCCTGRGGVERHAGRRKQILIEQTVRHCVGDIIHRQVVNNRIYVGHLLIYHRHWRVGGDNPVTFCSGTCPKSSKVPLCHCFTGRRSGGDCHHHCSSSGNLSCDR